MIPRYSRPEMEEIFSSDNKYKIMLEIETLACEKMAELGTIPAHVPAVVREKGNFDAGRIDEIEKEVKHDVIAFLTSVAEFVGEDARFIHQGMTSSDVNDTCLAVQMSQACTIILKDLDNVMDALKKRAIQHKDTLCIGRSHGIHAEPTTFGIKLAGHYAAFKRSKQRLLNAQKEIEICKLSGAVGTYSSIDPQVESYVAKELRLQTEDIATQVIPRDRHALLVSVLGIIASSIENIAVEIRHLQRTEVREAEEFFSKGQKGSSAMPHKRNPILTENITGIARIIRSTVNPALENIALWHERDISHSSVERVLLPDAFIALDFALNRLANVIENLIVYPENMQKNLEKTGGLYFSQKVLLALTQKGVSREDAYRLVQKNAMIVWEEGQSDFTEALLSDTEITKYLSGEEVKQICNLENYIKYKDLIFDRVFFS